MISSILILDYNQKEESKRLFREYKNECSFKTKSLFLANGNSEDYAYEYYKDGLIDVLISNKENNGCGFGTMQLLKAVIQSMLFIYSAINFYNHQLQKNMYLGL